MKTSIPHLVVTFLSCSNPSLVEADSAVRASLAAWARVNNGAPVLAYTVGDGFGPRGFGYRVTVSAPDSRTRFPRGEGLCLVGAFKDFVTKIWNDVAAMEAELDACDAANALEDAAHAAAE